MSSFVISDPIIKIRGLFTDRKLNKKTGTSFSLMPVQIQIYFLSGDTMLTTKYVTAHTIHSMKITLPKRRMEGITCHNTKSTKPASKVQKPAALEVRSGKKSATITITLNAAVKDKPIMMVPKILETLIARNKVKPPLIAMQRRVITS